MLRCKYVLSRSDAILPENIGEELKWRKVEFNSGLIEGLAGH